MGKDGRGGGGGGRRERYPWAPGSPQPFPDTCPGGRGTKKGVEVGEKLTTQGLGLGVGGGRKAEAEIWGVSWPGACGVGEPDVT